jgi:hypothetical protein
VTSISASQCPWKTAIGDHSLLRRKRLASRHVAQLSATDFALPSNGGKNAGGSWCALLTLAERARTWQSTILAVIPKCVPSSAGSPHRRVAQLHHGCQVLSPRCSRRAVVCAMVPSNCPLFALTVRNLHRRQLPARWHKAQRCRALRDGRCRQSGT